MPEPDGGGRVDPTEIGHQLRARRAAAARTVASVAADAGLSVPYIANLENGRGNPTLTALSRLAAALGMRLSVTLLPPEDGDPGPGDPSASAAPAPASRVSAEMPSSLIRFARSARFRRDAATMARALGPDTTTAGPEELSARLLPALAALGEAMGRDLSQDDWSRVLDALLLVAAHPLPPA